MSFGSAVAPLSWDVVVVEEGRARVVPKRSLVVVSFSSNQLLCLVASLVDFICEERSPANLVAERSVLVDLERLVEVAVTAAVLRRRLILDPPSSSLVEE